MKQIKAGGIRLRLFLENKRALGMLPASLARVVNEMYKLSKK